MRETVQILTQEQIEFYNNNGYLVVSDFFTPQECDWMLKIFEANADETFRAIKNIERWVPEIREKVVKNSRLILLVEGLHNNQAMGYLGSQVLFKRAHTKYGLHAWNPHQDAAYVETPYGTYVSAIIALAQSSAENGGMYIYPGSHIEKLLPYEPHPSYDPDHNPGHYIKVPAKYKNKRLDLNLEKGSLYVQHGNLIHGSYQNRSDRSRPHFGIMCLIEGTPFNPGSQHRFFTPFKEKFLKCRFHWG